jgi:DeoR/GlpR family transcriptional regulator of sugar metabolism
MSERKRKPDRKAEIMRLLRGRDSMRVYDLARAMGVSLSTARRDLDTLEAKRLVRRKFGSARLAASDLEMPLALRAAAQSEEKQRIARLALEEVSSGDTIYISGGSTTLEFARLLAGQWRLTVITNALRVANLLVDQPGIDLILLGGALRPDEQTLHGHLAEWAAQQLRADTMFYGIEGISLRYGLTHSQVVEVNTDRAITRMVKRVIVLADHTKFERVAPVLVMPITDVHKIITGRELDHRIVEGLTEAGLRVRLA